MSIEGLGHLFSIYFQVLYVLCFTRPRYQVSVYRTIGPLVLISVLKHRFWVLVEAVLTSTHNLSNNIYQTFSSENCHSYSRKIRSILHGLINVMILTILLMLAYD